MNKLKGTFTALVSPFQKGLIDEKSFVRLIQRQLKDGVDGFVVNGTTGESPTLTAADRKRLYEIAASEKQNHTLILGVGSNSTAKALELVEEANQFSADAVLAVVPYYNKPPQAGLVQHFKAIADRSRAPVLLYNVPGRTITSLTLDSIVELAKHSNICGIKEASGQLEFDRELRRACPKDFVLLTGDDGTYDGFMELGGDGVISVASHVIPKAFKERKVSEHLDLVNALFSESNPIPVKMALYLMKLIDSPEVRLPLVTASEECKTKLTSLLRSRNLL